MSERRLTVYLVALGLVALLFVVTAYAGKAYWGQSGNRDAWVKQNELLIASLPVYPGAVEAKAPYTITEPAASPLQANDATNVYWTTQTYALPPTARSDIVLAFYAQHLTEWSGEPEVGSSCKVLYKRGRAMLELTACDSQLKLSVNYLELSADNVQ